MSEFPGEFTDSGRTPFADSAFLPDDTGMTSLEHTGNAWRTRRNAVCAPNRRERTRLAICRNAESCYAVEVRQVQFVERKAQCFQAFAHAGRPKRAPAHAVSITSLEGRLLARTENARSDSANQGNDRSSHAPFTLFSGSRLRSANGHQTFLQNSVTAKPMTHADGVAMPTQ